MLGNLGVQRIGLNKMKQMLSTEYYAAVRRNQDRYPIIKTDV